MNASAKNMEAVAKAKKNHDVTCPWGGEGKRVLMTGFDIDRIGWEEGDVIAGVVVVASDKVATGRMVIECDAEPTSDENVTEEIENKDLVHA